MIKVKWLYSELPNSLGDLAKILLREQYSETKGNGFILSLSSKEKLSGKYIEKTVSRTVAFDPFGNETEQDIITYYICQFDWQAETNLLCITDPPRSLRKFIGRMQRLLGIGFVISDVSVDPLKWLNGVEKSAGKAFVTHISATGIRTPKGGLAKVSVSGKKDVRDDFYSLVSPRRHKIDLLKFTLNFGDDIKVTAEVTKLGVCKIKSYNSKVILDEFRKCLDLTHDESY